MFWKFMFHGGNGLQPMAPTNKHMSALVKKNNFAWKLLTSFGCFFSTNNDEILPNQTQGCSQKKAHFSTVCTLHRVLTTIMLVKPMIPKWSGVKKNCPPHWRGTWVCQRLRCPLMLNGELWWIIIFGNRFFCNGDGIEKTSQDHLEPELPTDYILYKMIPPPGDTSSSTLSLATNV